MDETFDFRPYVAALARHWWLVLGGTILAGLLAVGLSFLLPPTYQGNALVLVVDPGQVVEFDPRFEAVVEERPLQAYPQLATSDSVLQALLAEIGPAVGDVNSLTELREILAVSTANDPSLLSLAARHGQATTAALIANRWAEIFVAQANEVAGDQGSGRLQFYANQRDVARGRLDAAEEALADFQGANRERIVGAELAAQELALAAHLAETSRINRLHTDVTALRAELAQRETPLLLADQLAVLLLYGRAFGSEMPAGQELPDVDQGSLAQAPLSVVSQQSASAPITIQLDASLAAPADRGQLLAALDSLAATLETIATGIDQQIRLLEPQILTLQQQLQALAGEAERRRQEVTLANETYTALERQVAAETITSEDAGRGLRLASRAVVPDRAVAPRPLLNGALAAVVAFAALVSLELYREWRGH